MTRALAALAAAIVLSACGTGQTRLGAVFREDEAEQRAQVMARLEEQLRALPQRRSVDAAVGVAEGEVLGMALPDGVVWRHARGPNSMPALAGEVVVVADDGGLSALAALDGRQLWRRSTGGQQLVGAGDDGEVTVLTLSSRSNSLFTFLAVSRDGTVLRQLESERPLGTPAVRASVAFIPWRDMHVTAYDLSLGVEVGRVSLPPPVSHAFVSGGEIFFGEDELTRFDEHISHALSGTPPRLLVRGYDNLPLRLLPRGSAPLPPAAREGDLLRAYARPTARPLPLGIDGGRHYVTHGRILEAYEQDTGLVWVKRTPSLFGGAAFPGGFVGCDATGAVTLFSARSGTVLRQRGFGRTLQACVVMADNLRAPDDPQPPAPLAEQLGEALRVDAPDAIAEQRRLLKLLSLLAEGPVTRVLIELSTDPRVPLSLVEPIKTMVSARRDDPAVLLDAIERAPDLLRSGSRPPPVGALAEAMAALGDRRAGPPLARLLVHPQVGPAEARSVARALEGLATITELPELVAYFTLYRASDGSLEGAEALASVARTLLAIGGRDERDLVHHAAHDQFTVPHLRPLLAQIVGRRSP